MRWALDQRRAEPVAQLATSYQERWAGFPLKADVGRERMRRRSQQQLQQHHDSTGGTGWETSSREPED
jgi:hypothetical protein